MRWLAILLTVACSISAQAGMGIDEARHLLLRTEFGAAPGRVAEFAGLDRAGAVDRLLAAGVAEAASPAPAWADDPPQRPRNRNDLSQEERRRYLREQGQMNLELRAWWLDEMLATASPLTERMTLFWHNHFVSSAQKVRVPQLMYRQNRLLRREALGNFGSLLKSVARDPAMVVYLDSARNRKDAPNENFARELMELFTLGEGGGYTEQDIREAARAFTGWSLDRNTGDFRFYRVLHDSGMKTVLGHSGRLDGDAVLDILLRQPATAEFIVAKLWREFISPAPEPAEVQRLARLFRESGYEIRPLMRAMLLSDAFWAERNRGVLVKSPVEFLLGTLKSFKVSGIDPRLLALALRQMGQDLFAPPNVKGWPGGEHWINANTLLARNQTIERLFRGQDMANAAMDAQHRLDSLADDETSRRAQFIRMVMAVPPSVPPSGMQGDRLAFARSVALDPAWNLK